MFLFLSSTTQYPIEHLPLQQQRILFNNNNTALQSLKIRSCQLKNYHAQAQQDPAANINIRTASSFTKISTGDSDYEILHKNPNLFSNRCTNILLSSLLYKDHLIIRHNFHSKPQSSVTTNHAHNTSSPQNFFQVKKK